MAVYYTKTEVDTLLLQKASYTHSHGVYEPIFSKSTGYSYWDGIQWQYKNEEYSLSSHLHTGTYQPYDSKLVDIVNITPTDGVFLVGNGTTWVAESGTTARASLGAAGTMVSNTFSANQIISVTDNTNEALRITQTGTGNALVVEDSTSPDSSPFVIDASGVIIAGGTTSIAGAGGITGLVQIANNASIDAYSADSFGRLIEFQKSRGATRGTNTVVQSGDALGTIMFSGADGAQLIRGASITAAVDGTPSTNDMPGRLVFSTTADGASSTTERMRIDSSGRVGIGAVPSSASKLQISDTISDSTAYSTYHQMNLSATSGSSSYTGYSVLAVPTSSFAGTGAVLSVSGGVTNQSPNTVSQTRGFSTSYTTTGGGVLTNRYGFYDSGLTLTSGTVTNNSCFYASSLNTGATNNYGFSSNIASGTGRWNFYAAGTADNYFAGRVLIGTTANNGGSVEIATAPTAVSNSGYGISQYQTIPTGATTLYAVNATAPSTSAASYTVGTLRHYQAGQGTIGAGSNITTQVGFYAGGSLIGAASNYGFLSNIASGTGRWNFYAAGTAANYFAGVIELGHLSDTTIARSAAGKVTIEDKEIVTVSDTQILTNKTLASPVFSGTATNFQSTGIDDNATSTVITISSVGNIGVRVSPSSWGSDQYPLDIGTGSAFNSDIANNTVVSSNGYYNSGWKYKNTGTAALLVVGGDGGLSFLNASSGTAGNTITLSERIKVTPAGDFVMKPQSSVTLSNNGEMAFQLTSNTSLVIKVRGSDGITRSTTLTLA